MLSVGSLFTGIGLLDYGLHLAGLTDHRWVCEQDEWRRERILAQRFPDAVRYADVRDAGAGWEPVDVIAGGFPCKGVSAAGKREGFGHPETVLWREMARAVRELRPRYVLVENVANILGLHDGAVWGEVLGDLAALGYDVTWDCLPAAAVGAPHLRDRVFAVAALADRMAGSASESRDRSGGEVARPGEVERAERLHGGVGAAADAVRPGLEGAGVRGAASDRAGAVADSGGERRQQVAGSALGDEAAHGGARRDRGQPHRDYVFAGHGEDSRPGPTNGFWRDADWLFCRDGRWRPVEPGTFPLAHGAPARVGRLRAYGNAIVAQTAATFIESYLDLAVAPTLRRYHLSSPRRRCCDDII